MDRTDFDVLMSEYQAAEEGAREGVAETLYGAIETEVNGLKESVDRLRGEQEDISARYEALRKRYVERFRSPKDLYDEEPPREPTIRTRSYDELFRRD